MLHRVAQGGGGIDRGKDFAARGLDVAFEALDLTLHVDVRRFFRGKRRRGGVTLGAGALRGLARASSSWRAGS